MSDVSAEKQSWVERVLGVRLASFSAQDSTERPLDEVAASGAAVRLAKGLLLWNTTRSHISSEIMKLQQTIVADMQDHPDLDEIIANLGNLEDVLEHLDDRLSDRLGELRGATDPAAKNKISAQARSIVKEMQKYVASDPLMQDIDDNGFVALTIKTRAEQALGSILQTI